MGYSTMCRKCANSSEAICGDGLVCECFGFALRNERDGCFMYSKKKPARLVKRARNSRHGGTYEIWDVGNDVGVYVDFCACAPDTDEPETMAFPVDLGDWSVVSWAELGYWPFDATGGRAISDLGYEPVEEDES